MVVVRPTKHNNSIGHIASPCGTCSPLGYRLLGCGNSGCRSRTNYVSFPSLVRRVPELFVSLAPERFFIVESSHKADLFGILCYGALGSLGCNSLPEFIRRQNISAHQNAGTSVVSVSVRTAARTFQRGTCGMAVCCMEIDERAGVGPRIPPPASPRPTPSPTPPPRTGPHPPDFSVPQ